MDELKVYTDTYFIEDVKSRFYPRDLIIAKNDEAMRNVLNRCLEKLDQYCYQVRFYECSCVGGNGGVGDISPQYADLTNINIDGIEVKKVTQVMSTRNINSILTIYTQVLGQTPFYYNIIRNQDTFIEFMLTQQLAAQLNKKFKNKDLGWMYWNGKLLLDGKAFPNDESVLITFYPHFKINIENKKWELFANEAIFIGNLMEAMLEYREGRSQTELDFTGFSTNADKLWEEGKEIIDKIIETFIAESSRRIGKRF